MKYFFDQSVGVRAFESDGSQDFLITGDMQPMSPEEVHQHLNPAPSAEQLANEARLWRDSELARADIGLNKVQDGMGVGTVASWREYRCLLRDWPEHASFPDSSFRPVAPDAPTPEV